MVHIQQFYFCKGSKLGYKYRRIIKKYSHDIFGILNMKIHFAKMVIEMLYED